MAKPRKHALTTRALRGLYAAKLTDRVANLNPLVLRSFLEKKSFNLEIEPQKHQI
jgi:hypothetical protein